MGIRTLTLHELNRTLLARQLLLKREAWTIPDTVTHLIAVQAQVPNPPYIGLWTRLENVQRETLTQHMENREILRVAMMRSTLQLMTTTDHQRFRAILQPALSRALKSFYGKRAKGLDIEKLVEVARPFLEAAPRTTGELRAFLTDLFPDNDGDAMAYAVRNHLPIVQVPPSGTWGSGSRASYTTIDTWLDDEAKQEPAQDLKKLFHRYLHAFGPASIMDFQAWAGMTSLKNAMKPFVAELDLYHDENGKELYDLPELNIIDGDTVAKNIDIYAHDFFASSSRSQTGRTATPSIPSANASGTTCLYEGMVCLG